ncbi:hypothetical protein B0H63DRAFT_468083 [Podospora didyma]|uniref:Uncharacterized protein n=1 Tax=Podospora didyma TaxID=330526 RepID=A0AAE0NS92_9PEZI|nr:hypothetical protein B0H63DRAFT_468083 [Podospora didyma]
MQGDGGGAAAGRRELIQISRLGLSAVSQWIGIITGPSASYERLRIMKPIRCPSAFSHARFRGPRLMLAEYRVSYCGFHLPPLSVVFIISLLQHVAAWLGMGVFPASSRDPFSSSRIASFPIASIVKIDRRGEEGLTRLWSRGQRLQRGPSRIGAPGGACPKNRSPASFK